MTIEVHTALKESTITGNRHLIVKMMISLLLVCIYPSPTSASYEPDSDLGGADISFIGERDDSSGSVVDVKGDINGDGCMDLIAGSPDSEDEVGFCTGSISILFGSPDMELGEFHHYDFDVTIIGENEGDLAGSSIATFRDSNGDGIDELAIGAWGSDWGGSSSGSVYIFYGREDGWETLNSMEDADIIIRGAMNQCIGYSLAGGDFDGDGRSDIITGSPCLREGGLGSGGAYIFFSDEDGFPPLLSTEDADITFIGEEAGDNAGYTVYGRDDIDGDGYDDIFIGAYGSDRNGSNAGATYIFYGREEWETGSIELSSADTIIVGESPGDFSSRSFTWMEDADGDLVGDILIGAPRGDTESLLNVGKVYILYGTGERLEGVVHLADSISSFYGESSLGEAGATLSSCGDMNGDSLADFIVGASLSEGGGNRRGEVYLIYGVEGGWDEEVSLSSADASFIGEDDYDYAGGSISCGDMDGDGRPDIIIGAPGNDEGGTDSGKIYIYLSYLHFDDDGDGIDEDGGDCDDNDATVYPEADEIPYNGVDEDCDGIDLTDMDGDGFDGEEAGGTDCDDDDPLINPSAEETPYNNRDEDCDGEDMKDVDGDGWNGEAAGGEDCNDNDPAIYPRAREVCDSRDNDCDSRIDEGCGKNEIDEDEEFEGDTRGAGCNCENAPLGEAPRISPIHLLSLLFLLYPTIFNLTRYYRIFNR